MLLAEPPNEPDRQLRRLVRHVHRARGPVLERRHAALPKPTDPFRYYPHPDAEALRGLGIGPVLELDPRHQQQPGRRRALRITMELHPGLSSDIKGLCRNTIPFSERLRTNNVFSNYI